MVPAYSNPASMCWLRLPVLDQSDIAAIELGESAVLEIADQNLPRGTVIKINPVSQSKKR